MQIIDLDMDLDPKLLQVNRRLKGGHWVPTEVKQAMQTLQDYSRIQIQQSGWVPSKDQHYRVTLNLTFSNRNSDIDGPVKRTMDAVFRGMREAVDVPAINDARVIEMAVTKRIGLPRIYISVEGLDSTSGL